MRRIAGAFLLLAAAAAPLTAGSGGSAYSIFGVGDLRLSSSLESAGRAYTGLAFAPFSSIGTMSAASWHRLDRVTLEAGFLYEGFSSSDGSRSLYRAAANVNGALLALPVSQPDGIVIAGGFVPYSNVSFNTFTRGSEGGTDYVLNQVGSGGLGRGFIGVSWAPAPWLAVGGMMDYLFGSLEREERLTTNSPTGVTRPVSSVSGQSLTSSGFGGTASVIFTGFNLIHPDLAPLSLGLLLTPGTTITTTTRSTFLYPAERDTTDEVEGDLGLPLTTGVGLSWTFGTRTVLLAEVHAQQWGKTRVNDAPPPSVRNSRRLAVGVERLPSREAVASWLDRLALRAGAAWHATYYEVNGTAVDEWLVTAGAGLPLFGGARLHLAGEYAARGTTENGLIRDNIFRVTASLTLTEEWFLRPPAE
jgi:hypothetical protein